MNHRSNALLNRSFRILRREIKHLETLSIGNKLPYAAAKDLVAYIKLLREIKALDDDARAERARYREEQAKKASQEHLEALASKESK